MSGHARLSPSAAARWIACPGSIRMTEHLADTESEAAAEGTFAHQIAGDALDIRNAERQRVLLDDTFDGAQSTCGRFTLDADMREPLNEYLRVVYDCVDANRGELLVEQKVRLKGLANEVSGTADAIVVSADGFTVDVFDLKFGQGVEVDVCENPQLRIYALGAILTHDLSPAIVRLHIVQPRHHRGGHSTETLFLEDLMSYGRDVLAPAVDRANAPDAELSAGDHCTWCLAKASCPALRAAALVAAKDVFADSDLANVPSNIPSPDDLTPAQVSEALLAFPLLEKWMKAVRSDAYARATRGEDLPGHKLVRKTAHRRWSDEDAAAKKLRDAGHDPFAPRKTISPAQAEKLLGKPAIEKLAFKPDAGTALVPLTDRRPAFNATGVFL